VPISTAVKISALAEDLGSQRCVAELLDVSVPQLRRWGNGGAIDFDNAARVDLLEFVVAKLSRIYEPGVVENWLQGFNPRLGDRRPVDVIRAGGILDLLDVIADERASGYV
jgi:hypothetical protein